jgi:AcrR family transcriptional regulator
MESGSKSRTAPVPARQRRTQAERRASTRAALLDATIDCLVEDGYQGTTTTRIVERAGVSRGAQVHHFPTKAELVAEAVRRLAELRSEEVLAEAREVPPDGRHRFELVLDMLWRIHTGPLFAASVELWVAARTDPELRRRLVDVEREVAARISSDIGDLFPDLAGQRAFREAVDASLAAMRGLALQGFVTGDQDVERRWPGIRRRLLAALDELSV